MQLYEENMNLQEALIRETKSAQNATPTPKGGTNTSKGSLFKKEDSTKSQEEQTSVDNSLLVAKCKQ
jgi:hypothetical protein